MMVSLGMVMSAAKSFAMNGVDVRSRLELCSSKLLINAADDDGYKLTKELALSWT